MTPEETKNLETYLRKKFELDAIDVRRRHKKDDSVEVFVKDEFIGVIYKDDEDNEVTYQFQMAILEDDPKD
jgi:Protein of unknown function (DUF3126)